MNPATELAEPRADPPTPPGSPDWFHESTTPADAPDSDAPPTPAVAAPITTNLALPSPRPDGQAMQPWPPRTVRRAVIAVSVVAGLIATIGGPAPTGSNIVDTLMVATAVGLVTWLGAAALRWDMAVASILAGLASWSIVGLVIGFVAGVCGYAIPDRRGAKSVITACMVGVTLNLFCRSQLDWFFGASSLIGITAGLVIAIIGARRRTAATRRALRIGVFVAAPLAAVGVIGLAYGVWSARTDLRVANAQAEVALDLLGDGDVDGAQAAFAAAANGFDDANAALTNPAAQLARFVPIVAQHRHAAVDLSVGAAATSTAIADQLERVDLDSLTVTDGQIDVDRVRSLQGPLLAIQTNIEELEASIAGTRSPWLIGPATDKIDELADDVARQAQRGDDALAVAIAAPGLLGGDGPRVYFIGFTTPAEARGLGGFMGNWAEMTVDNGKIEITKFGRSEDLDQAALPGSRFVTGPADWLARYGLFQLNNGENGSTGAEPFKNVNMSPNMESTGRVIAELYPQSGGQAIDGVFVLDVYTLARFLQFTGPIALPEGSGTVDGGQITADDAAEFLLNDQYDQVELDDRVDVLETFSRSVVDALLTGSLPPPAELVEVLGPMVEQGRFAAYAVRADEQDMFRRTGLSGTLPDLDAELADGGRAGDAIAIAFNNAAGNKIDYYLASSATYTVDAVGTSGAASATLELVMTNGAPTEGEPSYVIGSPIGLPIGENRTYVSVFSRLPVQELLIDGKPIDPEPGVEAGYFVTSAFVQIPAGQTVTLTFTMNGLLPLDGRYVLDARTPPSVAPTPIAVDVTYRADDASESERLTAARDEPGTLHVATGDPAGD